LDVITEYVEVIRKKRERRKRKKEKKKKKKKIYGTLSDFKHHAEKKS
jgi:hypothetical protein